MLMAETNENAILGLGEDYSQGLPTMGQADYSQGLPTMGDFGQITENTTTGGRIAAISWVSLGIIHDLFKYNRNKSLQGVFAGAEAIAGGASVYYGSQIVFDNRVDTGMRWIVGILTGVIGLWSIYDLHQAFVMGRDITTLSEKGKRTLKLVTGQGF